MNAYDILQKFKAGNYTSFLIGKIVAITRFMRTSNGEPICHFLFYDGTDVVIYLLYEKEADKYQHLKEGDIIRIERPHAIDKQSFFSGLSTNKKPYCLKSMAHTEITTLTCSSQSEQFEIENIDQIAPFIEPIFQTKALAIDFYQTWNAKPDRKPRAICVICK